MLFFYDAYVIFPHEIRLNSVLLLVSANINVEMQTVDMLFVFM